MSVSAPEVSVLIVSHDSGDVLPICLRELRDSGAVNLEVILVDNASKQPPRDELRVDRLICNPDNPGFAVACNQGAAIARAPWLLFLNPDCFLSGRALESVLSLARALNCSGTLGALGVQLRDSDGQLQAASWRRDPTPARIVSTLMRGRSAIEQASLAGNVPDASDSGCPIDAQAIEVEAISGALMLIPRASFDAVGGFDAGYRLHFEDLDLCRRLRQRGFSIYFAGGVSVPHLKGTSSRRRPYWVAWQKHRGWRRYFERFDAAALPLFARSCFRALLWLALPLLLARAAWSTLSKPKCP